MFESTFLNILMLFLAFTIGMGAILAIVHFCGVARRGLKEKKTTSEV